MHLGDPCIHCGAANEEVASGPCPKSLGLAAHHRTAAFYGKQLTAVTETFSLESKRLNNLIAAANANAALIANSLDLAKIEMAESFMYAGDYERRGEDGFTAIRDAIAWFSNPTATGGLRKEYFGVKNYDRWRGQREDHQYGYGPRHGSTCFQIGLIQEARQREFSEEEKDAAIYYLANLAQIQIARKAAL